MDERTASGTFLFTDVEGSTRLWDEDPERMRPAMARHDALLRRAVTEHRGEVVKMTGDGVHAIFGDPLEALEAAVDVQRGLAELERATGLKLRVRCGVHAGTFERRDNDYYGTAVNRAARIMAAGHAGQVVVSATVVEAIGSSMIPGLAFRDLGRVRLRDLARAEQLFQVIHPGLRTEFPALRSLEKTPNNLPVTFSSFVGREREVAEVRELLGRTRLLTIAGMGGLGKTRLALQVAAEAMDRYQDGVWLVELAPLQDARRVAQAAASALGVHEEPGHPVREALEAHVRDRQMLMILDNCEHLLEACAELARALLTVGDGVRILATSREPLRIAGEATYPIAGLPVPGPQEDDLQGAVAGSEAARLFLERAAAARPDFALTAGNAPAIAAICRSLDGIPLAIELAAARVRVLPVDEIAVRMRDRFRLLTGGDPTALPRQRTLRSLIDWSYDLLPPAEQTLFRKLSVFAGGWTLESAEAVCGGAGDGPKQDNDVLDVLGRLVEKSLVALDDEQRRYHLLETVREYAQERLDEAGEQDRARECHLAHYLALAEKAKPQLMGPDQGRWFALLDDERENVLRAHAWARGSPAAGEADLRLVGEMKFYWINRGLLELGHRVMVEALEHRGAQTNTPLRMRGLFHAGQLRYTMGLYREARECLEEGLAIARQLDFQRGISSLLQPLGMAATAQGEFRIARKYLEEALALAQAQGEKHQLAGAYNALAQLDRAEGHPETTPPLYGEVVRLLREAGDIESAAIGQLNLAMVSIIRGQADEGRALTLEALATGGRTQSRPVVKSVLEVCAGLAALRRDWIATARFYGAAEAQARETGARRDPADEAFLAPRVELARAALSQDAFQRAVAAGRSLTYEQALAESAAWLQDLEATVGKTNPAVTSR